MQHKRINFSTLDFSISEKTFILIPRLFKKNIVEMKTLPMHVRGTIILNASRAGLFH